MLGRASLSLQSTATCSRTAVQHRPVCCAAISRKPLLVQARVGGQGGGRGQGRGQGRGPPQGWQPARPPQPKTKDKEESEEDSEASSEVGDEEDALHALSQQGRTQQPTPIPGPLPTVSTSWKPAAIGKDKQGVSGPLPRTSPPSSVPPLTSPITSASQLPPLPQTPRSLLVGSRTAVSVGTPRPAVSVVTPRPASKKQPSPWQREDYASRQKAKEEEEAREAEREQAEWEELLKRKSIQEWLAEREEETRQIDEEWDRRRGIDEKPGSDEKQPHRVDGAAWQRTSPAPASKLQGPGASAVSQPRQTTLSTAGLSNEQQGPPQPGTPRALPPPPPPLLISSISGLLDEDTPPSTPRRAVRTKGPVYNKNPGVAEVKRWAQDIWIVSKVPVAVFSCASATSSRVLQLLRHFPVFAGASALSPTNLSGKVTCVVTSDPKNTVMFGNSPAAVCGVPFSANYYLGCGASTGFDLKKTNTEAAIFAKSRLGMQVLNPCEWKASDVPSDTKRVVIKGAFTLWPLEYGQPSKLAPYDECRVAIGNVGRTHLCGCNKPGDFFFWASTKVAVSAEQNAQVVDTLIVALVSTKDGAALMDLFNDEGVTFALQSDNVLPNGTKSSPAVDLVDKKNSGVCIAAVTDQAHDKVYDSTVVAVWHSKSGNKPAGWRLFAQVRSLPSQQQGEMWLEQAMQLYPLGYDSPDEPGVKLNTLSDVCTASDKALPLYNERDNNERMTNTGLIDVMGLSRFVVLQDAMDALEAEESLDNDNVNINYEWKCTYQ